MVLDFLNQNSGAVVAIATIAYAILKNWKLVLETRKMRKAPEFDSYKNVRILKQA